MEDILVPIFICCVLPLGVVVTVFVASMFHDKKNSEVLIKAIENNPGADVEKLSKLLTKPQKSPREIRNRRLLLGCIGSMVGLVLIVCGFTAYIPDEAQKYYTFGGILLAVGISFLVVYLATRKQADAK